MRPLIAFAALLPLVAQTPEAKRRKAEFPEAFVLVELARSAPPEFAARGILHVLEHGNITDRGWRKELALEAIAFSRGARHKVPRRLPANLQKEFSREVLWASAYRLGLDELSLSTRAIAHLRAEDAKAARTKFAELSRPVATSPGCREPFVDDVSAWYKLLRSFQPTQQEVLSAIRGIRSHSEIKPAAAVILSRRGPVAELGVYAGALAQALTTIETSDRAFHAALSEAGSEFVEITTSLDLFTEPKAALAEGWKQWLVAGFEREPCAENTGEAARKEAAELLAQRTGVALTAEQWRAKGKGEAATIHVPTASKRTAQFRKLLFGDSGRPASRIEKETPAWREEFTSYVRSIEQDTQSSDESAEDFFLRRSQDWSGALFVAPPSETRDRALAQYIAFLLTNAAHIDPVLWFAQVEAMAESTKSMYGDSHRDVLDKLEQTGHPVLTLYARLEKTWPSRPKVN